MNSLLLPSVNSLRQSVKELKKCRQTMLRERRKARTIKDKVRHGPKDSSKLIGIKNLLEQKWVGAQRAATEADQWLADIKNLLEKESISLKPGERRIILNLKKDTRAALANCREILTSVHSINLQ